jgi:hypothetical protein
MDVKAIKQELDIPVMQRNMFVSPPESYENILNSVSRRAYVPVGRLKHQIYFAAFDEYVNYAGTKKLVAELVNGDVMVLNILRLGTRLFFIYGKPDSDKDEFVIYANEMDPELKILGSSIVVKKFATDKRSGSIMTAVSDDRTRLAFIRLPPQAGKEKLKVQVAVFSDSFSELWSATVTTDKREKDALVQDVKLDNKGNLYIKGDVVDGNPVNNKLKYYPFVTCYFAQTKVTKTFDVGSENGENSMTCFKMINDVPYLAGVNFFEKNSGHIVLRTIDAAAQNLGLQLNIPIDDELFKAVALVVHYPRRYWMVNLAVLPNNSIVATVENNFLHITPHGNVGAAQSSTMQAISFGTDGKVKWTVQIIKRQASPYTSSTGHLLLTTGNTVIVLYNDSVSNYRYGPESKKGPGYTGKGPALVVAAEIDENGKFTHRPLSNDPAMKGFTLDILGTSKISDGVYFSRVADLTESSKNTRNAVLRLK